MAAPSLPRAVSYRVEVDFAEKTLVNLVAACRIHRLINVLTFVSESPQMAAKGPAILHVLFDLLTPIKHKTKVSAILSKTLEDPSLEAIGPQIRIRQGSRARWG